ncbi:AraC family transcriptional regulator [Halioglobus maricola]|uniref:AraC family transcriptional regulator n=1 Tax=Halioglobus maricola TaxID=2601894 RepID=A0A5P9NMA0_9GAMM|nr:helix-turn-helix domain-containing protein [Halioglobus maricola]QFU76625.1 AraC family transcriptional regulator [Halioglobus maricola]
MLITWTNVLQILLVVLGSLLGYYLHSTRRNRAMTVFLFALVVHNLLRLVADLVASEYVQAVANSLRFFYAPLVYFATCELLYRDFRYRPIQLLHLLPFAGVLVWRLIVPEEGGTLAPLLGLLMIAYIAASFHLVARFKQIIARTRSTGEPEGLRWLERILYAFSALIVLELLRSALGFVLSPQRMALGHALFLVGVCLALAYLVLQGMRRPALLPAVDTGEQALGLDTSVSSEDRPSDPALAERLAEFMAVEKPYLNPQLAVSDLASDLGVPGRALSEVINDVYKCNFSEFINRARVEEARTLIASPGQQGSSLLDVGLGVGFNSKTSFNVMFKRYTGLTPSAYRKQRQSA